MTAGSPNIGYHHVSRVNAAVIVSIAATGIYIARRFGRHAADMMKWLGGRGGCWSPPGHVHRPGCMVPPPKEVFYREAPEAERSETLQCASAEWDVGTSQRVPSTGFGGGCGATGCFGRGWARGNREARGLPRRRRMGTKWEAARKRLA